MDALRFDRFSKAMAQRRRARHNLAQEATPTAAPPSHAPELFFVQSFQAGAITCVPRSICSDVIGCR